MIKFTTKDGFGRIVIDRANEGNAITAEMASKLKEIFEQAVGKANILMMTGAGADFTIGRDRKEPKTGTPYETFSKVSALNRAISAYPGILISVARGRSFGLGVGLIMRSDLAIVAEDARFVLDEVSHGIPPMFIMEEMVNHLGSKSALDIVLTGREFGAAEALRMGLVSRVVPTARLEAVANEIIQTLRLRDEEVVRTCKRYFRDVARLPADARPAFALVAQSQFTGSKH